MFMQPHVNSRVLACIIHFWNYWINTVIIVCKTWNSINILVIIIYLLISLIEWFWRRGHRFSVTLTCDLDPWPCDLGFNRDHPWLMRCLYMKFDVPTLNGCRVRARTMFFCNLDMWSWPLTLWPWNPWPMWCLYMNGCRVRVWTKVWHPDGRKERGKTIRLPRYGRDITLSCLSIKKWNVY
jgi:hypothetical protein